MRAQIHVTHAYGRAPLGAKGAEGAKAYPRTARYGCAHDASSAGRSVASVARYARPIRELFGGAGTGILDRIRNAQGSPGIHATTTVEPSESAFTGRSCVIGIVAAAPLTGDDYASKAHHPFARYGRTAARGRLAETPESSVGSCYGGESAEPRFSPRASAVLVAPPGPDLCERRYHSGRLSEKRRQIRRPSIPVRHSTFPPFGRRPGDTPPRQYRLRVPTTRRLLRSQLRRRHVPRRHPIVHGSQYAQSYCLCGSSAAAVWSSCSYCGSVGRRWMPDRIAAQSQPYSVLSPGCRMYCCRISPHRQRARHLSVAPSAVVQHFPPAGLLRSSCRRIGIREGKSEAERLPSR